MLMFSSEWRFAHLKSASWPHLYLHSSLLQQQNPEWFDIWYWFTKIVLDNRVVMVVVDVYLTTMVTAVLAMYEATYLHGQPT